MQARVLATVLALSMLGGDLAHAVVGTLADGNGQVIAWGGNFFGQCDVPPGFYTAIGDGGCEMCSHSLALRADGSLAAWGWNDDGQCNVPPGYDFVAVARGDWHNLALRSDGSLAAAGGNFYGECNVPPGTNYTAVAAGEGHNLVLRSDGSMAAWGLNTSGQCNVPSGTNYTAVACGAAHSLAIRNDGTLVAWGLNNEGQCNVPAGTFAAVIGGMQHSVALRTDGSLAAWGWNPFGQCNVPAGNDYVAISSGSLHGLAIRNDGSLAAWGYNDFGQCDVPSGVFVAVATARAHSLALPARTDYDGDLLVSGTGIRANLNRSITVAGNARLQTTMVLYNWPAMSLGGKLTLADGAVVAGDGAIVCGGVLELPSGAAVLSGNMEVQAGGLSGSGDLYLYNGARLTVGAGSGAYTGSIAVNSGFLAIESTGMLTPASLNVANTAELRIAAGRRLTVSAASSNAGSIQAAGSALAPVELEFRGPLSNAASTGLITARHAALRFTGGLSNYGSLALTEGTNQIDGNVVNQGTITVTGKATATFLSPLVQDQTLHVSAGSSLVAPQGITGSGDTTVGNGSHLETKHIRQDSLTIHAGGTVEIVSDLGPPGIGVDSLMSIADDSTDFVLIAETWGDGTVGSPGVAAGSVVAEPAAGLLVLLVAATTVCGNMLLRVRRRQ